MHDIIADLRISTKADIDRHLTHAVATAIEKAEAKGSQGILITRHDFSHFTVALTPTVPFRLIKERDLAGRA